MKEAPRAYQAALTNPQISPMKPTSHEDVTPLTRNKSNQAIAMNKRLIPATILICLKPVVNFASILIN